MAEVDILLIVLPVLLLAGAFGGLASGLMGIGGGLILVPVLFEVFARTLPEAAYPMHMAVATSLAVVVPTSLTAALAHRRRGSFSGRFFSRWAVWMAAGAALGTALADRMSGAGLAMIFAMLAGLMALKMVLGAREKPVTDLRPGFFASALPALPISVASALMGIGGATFSVPVMRLMGLDMHRAVGTAAMLGSVVAVPGVIGYMIAGLDEGAGLFGTLGYVHWVYAAILIPVTVMAAPVGAGLAHRLSRRRLELLFALVLAIAAARLARPALGLF